MMEATLPAEADPKLRRDLKTLVQFVEIYCRSKHAEAAKTVLHLKIQDLEALAGHPVELCEECQKLLTHAW